MAHRFLPCFLFLLLAGAQAQTLAPATISPGEAEAQKCEERIASVQRDVLGKYDSALVELQGALQKAADLEGALAVRAERQRLAKENRLSSANFVNDKALRALQIQTATRQQDLISQLLEDTLPKLVEFKKSLTVAGRLDEAVAVRSAIERLQSSYLPAEPPAPGTITSVDSLLRTYGADRARGDALYKGQPLIVHGVVVGYRPDADGKHYDLYLGGTPPLAGWVQCAFSTNDFRFHEENQFGTTSLVMTWGQKDISTLRIQRGMQMDIAGQGGGWDESARLVKCEIPK